MNTWLDLVAGLSFLVLAGATARTSRRFALLTVLTGAAWFVADVSSWALFVHRPFQLHTALGYADGRVRGKVAHALLGLSWIGAFIQPLGRNAAFMLSLGGLILVQSIRMRARNRLGGRTEAAVASRAVALVALGLMLPAGARLWGPDWMSQHDRPLALYTVLTALTALTLLAAVVARAAGGQADEVIELSEVTPDQTLGALRVELAAHAGSPSSEQLRAAVALLQANAELQATLTENANEVRRSRRRLVDAAVAERKRLENILATGALSCLDDLAHTLRALQRRVDDPTNTLIRAALDEAERSRDDVEQLARGLHPRVLAERGLRAALVELAERCPVPLTVDAPDARYGETAETALWYACTEAIANVVKHACAAGATIALRADAGALVADICDDGRGGATVTPGGGLAGLRDRLSALDGAVSLSPAADGGTHVRIRVPVQ